MPPEVFGELYKNPVNDTPTAARNNLRQALKLLTEAGCTLKGNKLVDTGRQASSRSSSS